MNDLFSAFGIEEEELQGLEKKPAAKKEKRKRRIRQQQSISCRSNSAEDICAGSLRT